MSSFPVPVVVPVVIAQESAAGGSGLPSIIFLVAMGAIFYFLIIRPQRQRARHQQQLVESLAVGDQVQTIGGIQGRISEMDDSTVLLEVESGRLRVARRAIGTKLDAHPS